MNNALSDFIDFRTLVERSPVAMVIVDSNGSIIYMNPRSSLLITTENPIIPYGRSFLDFIVPEEAAVFSENLSRATRGEPLDPFISTLVTGKVTRRIAEITLCHLQNAGESREATALFLRDLSFHKHVEEERSAMEQQLRAVYKMEALGQLARGIAHDLNNSLGAISGYSELIRQLAPADDNKISRYADQISSAAQRSAEVIRKVLTFARKNKLQVISFNLNEIIHDIVNLLESSLEKGIAIIQKFDARDAGVTGDPEQIQNAIVNLALNARDAMPSGGTLTLATDNIFVDTAFASSRPYKMTEGYYLRFSVSDTGAGMDKETLSHLFEPFFTTKEAGRGTGLGLASVYGSVKSHHGYIEVTSETGKGSTFTMYLPVNRCNGREETAPDGSPCADGALPRKAHIMVIDDDHSIAEMIFELLSWLDYTASIFTNATEAIVWYKSNSASVDLVITDLTMTAIDGLECFEKLRAINPAVKVLIATGYCLDEERTRLLKKGFSGILTKPFVSAELAKQVAEALTPA
ncbi:MAG: response regulator [Chitinispirillaceae bacterium]|nr:response regulator [Chitinispirillaceae bacterium]